MSETWVNVYEGGEGHQSLSPHKAQWRMTGAGEHDFLRVEHRINGHWHRPPVGMRGRDASHVRAGWWMVKR